MKDEKNTKITLVIATLLTGFSTAACMYSIVHNNNPITTLIFVVMMTGSLLWMVLSAIKLVGGENGGCEKSGVESGESERNVSENDIRDELASLKEQVSELEDSTRSMHTNYTSISKQVAEILRVLAEQVDRIEKKIN